MQEEDRKMFTATNQADSEHVVLIGLEAFASTSKQITRDLETSCEAPQVSLSSPVIKFHVLDIKTAPTPGQDKRNNPKARQCQATRHTQIIIIPTPGASREETGTKQPSFWITIESCMMQSLQGTDRFVRNGATKA